MKFAIVVPARKGSKGIKNKNLVKINDKHLIEYTLLAAKKSIVKQKFILTDDDKIKKISKKYDFNTEYIRPKKVSHSKTSLGSISALGVTVNSRISGGLFSTVTEILCVSN